MIFESLPSHFEVFKFKKFLNEEKKKITAIIDFEKEFYIGQTVKDFK